MTRDEFKNLLLLHGSNLEDWPETTLDPANRLLSRDERARDLLEHFKEFDTALQEATKTTPSGTALTGRILTRVSARDLSGERGILAFGPSILAAFGGAAALAILGLGFFAGSLDLVWLDGTSSNDLSLLLLGETQEFVDTL